MREKPLVSDMKRSSFSKFYSKYGTACVLVIMILVSALLSSNFLKIANITNVLRQITVVTILGFGATFVLILGEINVAYDSLIPLIGCLSCMAMVRTQNILIAVIVGVALGGLVGFFYGLLVTAFEIPSFIVGLAFGTLSRGIIYLITNGAPVQNIGDLKILGQGYIGVIPIPVIIMLVLLGATWFILNKTCFGRHVLAVGGNRAAAIASGIRANSIIRKVYVLDGLLVGLASVIFMARLNCGQPGAGAGYAFDAITGVVVGGTSLSGGVGNIPGTLIGAAVVGVINNIMNLKNISSYVQQIVQGGIILLAIVVDIKIKKSVKKLS